MDKNISNQRKSNRIQTITKVVLVCDHFQYIGTATNCSESGMYIGTPHFVSPNSNIKIILPIQEEALSLSASIKRIEKSVNLNDAIGVELLSPPPNYFDFIQKLQSSL